MDDATRSLAVEAVAAGALSTISAERTCTELRLVLREPAWNALTLLASWGVVERLDPRLEQAFRPPLLLPAIDDACGDDPDLHRRSWLLRLAALARPLGTDAAGWMRWLGFPADVIATVTAHLQLLTAVLERGTELRALPNSRLYVELGDLSDESLALAALAIADDDPALLDRLVEFATVARSTRLAVRGDDVVAAGVPAGPQVGMILGDLLLRTLDGELHGESRRAARDRRARGADRRGGGAAVTVADLQEHIRIATFALPLVLLAFALHEMAHAYVATWFGDPTPGQPRSTHAQPDPPPRPDRHDHDRGQHARVRVPLRVRRHPGQRLADATPAPARRAHLVRRSGGQHPAVRPVDGRARRRARDRQPRLVPARGHERPLVVEAAYYSMLFNAFLAVFNLLPIPPLDGGRIVAAIMRPELGREFLKIGEYGIFIILALVFFGGASFSAFLGSLQGGLLELVGTFVSTAGFGLER